MLSPTPEDAVRQDIDSNAVNADTGNVFNNFEQNENGLSNYLTQSMKQYQNIRYTSNDMTSQYNTPLAPEAEAQYQEWKKTLPQDQQNEYDYDLRGYFKEMNEAFRSGNEEWANEFLDQENGAHLTDTYKKPNHHTFSNYSMYAKNSVSNRADDNTRSEYYGGTWTPNEDGSAVYTPSMQNFWDTEELKNYFNNAEIGNYLNDTRENEYMYYQGMKQEEMKSNAELARDAISNNSNIPSTPSDNFTNDTYNMYNELRYEELNPSDGGLARYGK